MTDRLNSGGGKGPSDPRAIELMPGYVPPEQRKGWTPAQHCDFANQQLAWRDVNQARRAKGLPPVRWVVENKRVVLEMLEGHKAPRALPHRADIDG